MEIHRIREILAIIRNASKQFFTKAVHTLYIMCVT